MHELHKLCSYRIQGWRLSLGLKSIMGDLRFAYGLRGGGIIGIVGSNFSSLVLSPLSLFTYVWFITILTQICSEVVKSMVKRY